MKSTGAPERSLFQNVEREWPRPMGERARRPQPHRRASPSRSGPGTLGRLAEMPKRLFYEVRPGAQQLKSGCSDSRLPTAASWIGSSARRKSVVLEQFPWRYDRSDRIIFHLRLLHSARSASYRIHCAYGPRSVSAFYEAPTSDTPKRTSERRIDLLACRVHELYFAPIREEFAPRPMRSLSNAFTLSLKDRYVKAGHQ